MVIEYIYNSDEWTQGSREGFDWVGGLESQYKRGQTRRCTRLEHTRVADSLMTPRNEVGERGFVVTNPTLNDGVWHYGSN